MARSVEEGVNQIASWNLSKDSHDLGDNVVETVSQTIIPKVSYTLKPSPPAVCVLANEIQAEIQGIQFRSKPFHLSSFLYGPPGASKMFQKVESLSLYLEKFTKRWKYQTTWLTLEKSVCRSGSNSYNWTRNNRMVSSRKRRMSRLYLVTLII